MPSFPTEVVICFHSFSQRSLTQLFRNYAYCWYVVICFHSFSQRSLTQPAEKSKCITTGCDLLSFFFSTIFDTTFIQSAVSAHTLWFAFILFLNDLWHNQSVFEVWLLLLWFAFILFLNDLWHNYYSLASLPTEVVICFHSFSQRSLTQRITVRINSPGGCDLLSFFFSTIFDTTRRTSTIKIDKLWFAFILFLNDLWHNFQIPCNPWNNVVICFHSFSQRSLTQHHRFQPYIPCSCDLLSFFFSTIFDTTLRRRSPPHPLLWFAFILFLNDLWHNTLHLVTIRNDVVICFHSFSQRSLTQLQKRIFQRPKCCDLLSFFFSTIFDTTFQNKIVFFPVLWFAFILFLNDLWHNHSAKSMINSCVVICFHSFSQRSLTQLCLSRVDKRRSCDLLSFFFSTIFDTTSFFGNLFRKKLWFAFILFLNDLWHNKLETIELE